jgi:hypothetical protein
MALVAQGFRLTVQLKDTSNSTSTLRYDLQGADYAAASANAAIILAALDPVTQSNVSQYIVSAVFVEDAFALPVSAENAVKAEVAGLVSGFPNKTATFSIPAPSISIFSSSTGAGYNIVDLDSANLQTYAAIFEVGGQAFISDGENLADVAASLVSGKRITVKSRNP